MLSGVSPCAICHVSVPLSMSIAVIRPYGGLTSGIRCTERLGSPSPPRFGGAATGAPASVSAGAAEAAGAVVADVAGPFEALGLGLGFAFGFGAVPWTQSKSDFAGS